MTKKQLKAIARAEDVPYEASDDGGLLFNVRKAKNGILMADVRVYGHLTVNGVEYSYDRDFRVRLKRERS